MLGCGRWGVGCSGLSVCLTAASTFPSVPLLPSLFVALCCSGVSFSCFLSLFYPFFPPYIPTFSFRPFFLIFLSSLSIPYLPLLFSFPPLLFSLSLSCSLCLSPFQHVQVIFTGAGKRPPVNETQLKAVEGLLFNWEYSHCLLPPHLHPDLFHPLPIGWSVCSPNQTLVFSSTEQKHRNMLC